MRVGVSQRARKRAREGAAACVQCNARFGQLEFDLHPGKRCASLRLGRKGRHGVRCTYLVEGGRGGAGARLFTWLFTFGRSCATLGKAPRLRAPEQDIGRNRGIADVSSNIKLLYDAISSCAAAHDDFALPS
jgi:hypothetical protein